MKFFRTFYGLLLLLGDFLVPVCAQEKAVPLVAAQWIGVSDTDIRCPVLQRGFVLKSLPEKAEVQITAHGFYLAWLNGKRIGNAELAPGWTSYHKRLLYQTYNVRKLLKKGVNRITVQLAPGFYSGNCGNFGGHHYGVSPGLLLQLTGDGHSLVRSDRLWTWNTGQLISTDIYQGETRDLRIKGSGKFSGLVSVLPRDSATLLPQDHPPVRKYSGIKPIGLKKVKGDQWIADFGVNRTGVVRMSVSGRAGDTLIVKHAETLDSVGNLSKTSLREAEQTDKYILAGGVVTLEPWFTYHGFRYARVGLKRQGAFVPFKLGAICAVPMHSDLKAVGTFVCGNPDINKLQQAINQSLLSNFVDIPTDCPQRMERLGWTGDAQASVAVAGYNFDVKAFYAKYMADLAADLYPDGTVPNVIPNFQPDKISGGAPAWADAATIIPWQLYQSYGDTALLRRQYPAMQAWVEHMARFAETNNGFWKLQKGIIWGDWLAPEGETDDGFLCQVFYCHSLDILAQAAKVLKLPADTLRYAGLYKQALVAFRSGYLTSVGRTALNGQTACLLPLAFDLCGDGQRTGLVEKLVQDIREHNSHLNTGYIGTRYLLPVLVAGAQPEMAYDILLQKTYPGWLYMLSKGATTLWESWDAIKPDGSFNKEKHSLNHHILGCIGEWFYSGIAGIQPLAPGYHKIRIAPAVDQRLGWAKAVYHCPYGKIASNWKIVGGRVLLDVVVPKGTTAEIVVPDLHNRGQRVYQVSPGDRVAGSYHYEN